MLRGPSAVIKRSVVANGHKTSVSLEEEFWTSLKDIAHEREQTIAQLVSDIDLGRLNGNLSSALRLFVLQHYMNARKSPGDTGR